MGVYYQNDVTLLVFDYTEITIALIQSYTLLSISLALWPQFKAELRGLHMEFGSQYYDLP